MTNYQLQLPFQSDTITTCDDAIAGAVVNPIKRDHNGFGQMTKEWQQHGISVNTGRPGTEAKE